MCYLQFHELLKHAGFFKTLFKTSVMVHWHLPEDDDQLTIGGTVHARRNKLCIAFLNQKPFHGGTE